MSLNHLAMMLNAIPLDRLYQLNNTRTADYMALRDTRRDVLSPNTRMLLSPDAEHAPTLMYQPTSEERSSADRLAVTAVRGLDATRYADA